MTHWTAPGDKACTSTVHGQAAQLVADITWLHTLLWQVTEKRPVLITFDKLYLPVDESE